MADTRKRAAKTTKSYEGFTDDERAAMKEHAEEMKATASRGRGAKADADAESAMLEKIAEMSDSDRAMAERIHAIVKASAPGLTSKTWYGMPGYAKDGKVICFFQPAEKFKSRYATLGFSDEAKLDQGAMWPTYYALKELTPEVEARIAELVRTAAG